MTSSNNDHVTSTDHGTGRQLEDVGRWWQETPCGSQNTTATPLSPEYFSQLEQRRYRQEPFVFSFAQFTRYRGQKVLEIGVGPGTDFVQWVRAGADAHGVDLTEAAVEHVRKRLALEGLKAHDMRQGNGEALAYPDDSFDLVYSWGVLHHSASIERALSEVIRVLRPGGTGKIMLYNRHSLTAFYIWVKWALLRGRPFRSVADCLSRFVESPGTKAVTIAEVRDMLGRLGVRNVRTESVMTYQDRLEGYPAVRFVGTFLQHLVDPSRHGWFLTIEFQKPASRHA